MSRFLRAHRIACALMALASAGPLAAVAYAAIDGTVSIQCQINDRRSVGLNSNVNIAVNPVPSIAFANGVGASQANQVYQASRACTAGADSLDLNGTALKDSYGDNVALARVKAIYIRNTSTHTMTFGGGSNPWLTHFADAISLPPGGFTVAATPDATGWAVTATTGDLLNVTGTSTDTYDVVIVGGKT